MATIANLLVNLKADFGDADSKLEDLAGGFDRAGEAAEGAGDGVSEAGKKAEESGNGFDAAREKVADFAKELATMGLEALGLTSVFEVLKESIEVSAEIEAANIAIQTFTGDVHQAAEAIEEMEAIATAEALRFPEIVPAAQHMMALGFTVEETAGAMKVAGNAAWALGEPLAEVSRRMAQVALSGFASNRMLQTLGISSKELGDAMGVAAEDAEKTFKALDQGDKLLALQVAMGKFGEVGAKAADTVSGKWNELENSWHLAFLAIGDDLSRLTKKLEDFSGVVAGTVASMAVSIPDAVYHVLFGAREDEEEDTAEEKRLGSETPMYRKKTLSHAQLPEKGGTGPTDPNDVLKEHAAEARGPQEAKDAAEVQLKNIAGQKKANEAAAALDRARAESAINTQHEAVVAEINMTEDASDRKKRLADEDVRVAVQKMAAIGAINTREAEERNRLARSEVPLKTAAAYSVGPNGPEPEKMKEAAKKAAAEAAAEIEQSDAKLASQRQALSSKLTAEFGRDAVAKAQISLKAAEDEVKDQRTITDAVRKEALERRKILEEAFTKTAKTDQGERETAARADTEAKIQALTEAKAASERKYGAEAVHTLDQLVAHMREIGDIEAQIDLERARGVEAQIALLDPETDAVEIANKQLDAQKDLNDEKNKQAQVEQRVQDLLIKRNSILAEAQILMNAPDKIADALAGGIVDKPGKGKSIGYDIGKDIVAALRGVGKDLLGTAFHGLLKELGSELAKTAVGKAVDKALAKLGVSAQQANTAAIKELDADIKELAQQIQTGNTSATGPNASTGSGGGASASTPPASPAAIPVEDAQRQVALGDDVVRAASPAGAGAGGPLGAERAQEAAIKQAAASVVKQVADCNAEEHQDSGLVQTGLKTLATLAKAQLSLMSLMTTDLTFIATLTAIETFKPAWLAGGGTPPLGVPSIVGERGPELFVPNELGTIVPNDVMTSVTRSSVASNTTSSNVFNIHGARDARDTTRQIATFLRNTSSTYQTAAK